MTMKVRRNKPRTSLKTLLFLIFSYQNNNRGGYNIGDVDDGPARNEKGQYLMVRTILKTAVYAQLQPGTPQIPKMENFVIKVKG